MGNSILSIRDPDTDDLGILGLMARTGLKTYY